MNEPTNPSNHPETPQVPPQGPATPAGTETPPVPEAPPEGPAPLPWDWSRMGATPESIHWFRVGAACAGNAALEIARSNPSLSLLVQVMPPLMQDAVTLACAAIPLALPEQTAIANRQTTPKWGRAAVELVRIMRELIAAAQQEAREKAADPASKLIRSVKPGPVADLRGRRR